MIKAGIVGGAGYTGGELLRILLRHPAAQVAFVQSRSQAGQPVTAVHSDLLGDTELVFTAETDPEIDVLFLCLGHGASAQWLDSHSIASTVKIVDLSQDFRLNGRSGERSFVYGLPELYREDIRTANSIANPGCFATGLQIALLPLAAAGLLDTAYVTGITGATGAGQSLSATSHFPWRHANISAYKTLQHQHYHEVIASLRSFGGQPEMYFTPWRGDFPRGIYLSATVACACSLAEAQHLYAEFYATHPFTILSSAMIDLKMAVNTNKCLLHLEKIGAQLVVHAALDNLLKGASGQAVQNMNLLFGLEETTGLHLKASAF